MDVEELFLRITSGCVIIDYDGARYIVYDAKPMQKQLAQREYDRAYADFLSEGIHTKDDVERLLEERGVWTPEKADMLKNLEGAKGEVLAQLNKSEFRSKKKQYLLDQLDTIEGKITCLRRDKASLFNTTAEYLATLEKYKYLLFLLTYDEVGNRIWTSLQSFENTSESLIHHLLEQTFFDNTITEGLIRKVARTEPWRSTWISSCKTGQLFDIPMSHMTDWQRAVVSWSMLYDSIYENPDCPSDEVIQNDLMLDAWMQEQSEKRSKGSTGVANSKTDHGTVGIIVDSPEDAQRVYKLNDSHTRTTLRQREKAIREKGQLKEAELPDVAKDLQMRKNRLEAEGIKSRTKRG